MAERTRPGVDTPGEGQSPSWRSISTEGLKLDSDHEDQLGRLRVNHESACDLEDELQGGEGRAEMK